MKIVINLLTLISVFALSNCSDERKEKLINIIEFNQSNRKIIAHFDSLEISHIESQLNKINLDLINNSVGNKELINERQLDSVKLQIFRKRLDSTNIDMNAATNKFLQVKSNKLITWVEYEKELEIAKKIQQELISHKKILEERQEKALNKMKEAEQRKELSLKELKEVEKFKKKLERENAMSTHQRKTDSLKTK